MLKAEIAQRECGWIGWCSSALALELCVGRVAFAAAMVTLAPDGGEGVWSG